MLKFATPLIALAAATTPAAFAGEPVEIAVELDYDGTYLSENAGALAVIASLEDQARDACKYTVPVTHMVNVDRACVQSVVSSAITKIVAARDAAGLETATAFQNQAKVQLASLEQR